MKKLIYFVIAVMLLSAIPAVTYAQSNDPFEQETLKANNYNNSKREKKISRKKGAQTEAPQQQQQQQVAPAPAPVQTQEEAPKPKKKEMTISNPCDEEWLDFEFVSLVGSKSTQTIKLTCKFTNRDTNTKVRVGGDFLAYDADGAEHTTSNYNIVQEFYAMMDVPIKFSINVPGKMNPTKTKVMPVISFNVGSCRIEMRKVPIDWK